MATIFSTKHFGYRVFKHTMLGLSILTALLILFGAASNASAESGTVTIVNQTSQRIYVATAQFERGEISNELDSILSDNMVFNGWYDIEPGKSRDLPGKSFYVMQGGSRLSWPNRTELEGPVNPTNAFTNVRIETGVLGNFDYTAYSSSLKRFLNTNPAYTKVTYQNLDPGVWNVTSSNSATSSSGSSAPSSSGTVRIVNQTGTSIYVATAQFQAGATSYMNFNGWYEIEPGKSHDFTSSSYYVEQDGNRLYWPNRTEWEGLVHPKLKFDNVQIRSGTGSQLDSTLYYSELQRFLDANPAYTRVKYQNLDPGVWNVTSSNSATNGSGSSAPPSQPQTQNQFSAVEKIDENSIAELLSVAGDYVYWKDRGTSFLIRGQVINGRLTAAQTIDTNSVAELLAAAGEYVYWKDRGTTFLIRGKVINGRLTEAQTIDANSTAELLAAAGEYVYWKDRGTSFLIRGKVINGRLTEAQTIDANSTAELLAAAGDNVYWKDRGTTILFRGQVVAKTVTSSSPTSVPTAGSNPPSANSGAPSSTPAAPSSNTNAPSSAPSAPSSSSNTLPAGAATCPIDLCVTNITVSPNPPKRKQEINFTATFVNNSGQHSFNWVILLFDPNKNGPNKGFGESILRYSTIPSGVSTATATYTGVMGAGGCVPLYAQAAYYQGDSTKPTISGSDGQPFTINFEVCP